MGKIKSFFKSFIDETIDIRTRLLDLLIVGVIIGDSLSTISMVFIGNYGFDLITNILILIFAFISLWLSVTKKKTNLAACILIVTADYILLPAMFFAQGGNESGMPVWFMFSIIITFMMIEEWPRFVLAGLTIVVDSITMLIGYWHPELVKPLEGENGVIADIILAVAICGIIMSAMIWIYLLTYKRQSILLEKSKAELEEALIKAKNADKAKSVFLANMSHEIRTPINAVLGMNEMISRDSTEEKILDYSNKIDSSGQALLAIINDILDFSKIEAGSMELIPTNYKLSKMLNDIYNMVIIRAKEKNLELKITNDVNIPDELIGDEARVRQVIINIITNAIKYTNEGSVELHLEYAAISENDIRLKISVTDTGIGIKEENMDKLFTSFERFDLIKNRKIEGTGLGLAITKKFVEMMGGEITISSVYGEGSTFNIEINQTKRSDKPMGEFKITEDSSNSKYHESFTAPSVNVLVVDDIEMNLVVFSCLLQKTCINIDIASSGEECIKMSSNKKYDMIFLDHMMPEMDGLETLANMKESDKDLNHDTPVVMLTANAITGAREEYISAGFNDYLTKPIVNDELEELLIKYLPNEKVILSE